MSGTSSVPRATFGPTGFSAPQEADVLTGVLADMNAAFGGNLNTTTLSTPQGQLASSLAAIIGDKNAQFLFYASQCDPAFAAGRMQDGIARIYFITRDPARPTTVQALCTGLTGTPIPTGARAMALDGNSYVCTAGGNIDMTGSVLLPFACETTGPIACPVATLVTIYLAVPGWDGISNPSPGVPGNDVETRNDFERRRALSVAINAIGSLPSVLAAVLAVPNVLDAYAVENTTNGALTVGGVSLVAHSLYVAASGGDPNAIAFAIWSKKSLGCGTNGGTTVTVTDPSYASPAPSYAINFQVPAPTAIAVAVVIANSAAVPADAAAQVQGALLAAFAGADGGTRARIGGTVYASRYYAPIAALGAWAQIVSIEIGTGSGTPTAFSVLLPINQVPVLGTVTLSLV